MERVKYQSLQSYGWRLHVGILAFAVVVLVLDLRFPGWGEPILAAGAAVGISLLALRRFWTLKRFWTSMAVVTVLHVPMLVAAKPLADRFKFLFALPFALLDLILIMLVLSWISRDRVA
jgi:hypothetical protein